ncbi:p-hydroxycinnamoyl CoA hydratase/lyase [Streptomyces sp. NPDC005799]|uniref:p-hydroxycinnamoyl CoA hydratase/lyase n=1 Tax=Streptomyces sp. NPDC005799 TaxID=3154678 RepID=UPI0033F1649F
MASTGETASAAPSTHRELGTWSTVKASVENEIAWVVLNRPEKRNCMSPTLNDEMLEVLDAVALDREARVMVLTGAGEAFSAGMDLKEFFRDTDALSPVEREIKQRSCFEWQGPRLRQFPLPTIAMVNGYCFGGAFHPLGNCDLAVAADDAMFGLSEVNWGIVPGGNVPLAVAHTMSLRDAMYYSITGETFDGRKAAEVGLVNESVPRDRLRARVLEIAEMMKTKNTAIVRGTKETVRHIRGMGWTEAENYINAKFAEALYADAEDGRAQGLKQFLDDKSFRPGLEAYKR